MTLLAIFQAVLLIYDSGVIGSDRELATALWRRFFDSKDPLDPEKVEKLVSYVRRTLSVLDHIELDSLILGSKGIQWLNLQENK